MRSRAVYILASLGLLLAYSATSGALLLLHAPLFWHAVVLIAALAAWHALTALRIARSAGSWLHAAPYVTIISGFAALALASRYANVAHAPAYALLVYPLLLLAGAWPVATLFAAVRDAHAA